MRKLLLFSMGALGLLFIGLSGCTKFGKNVTIEGRVINPITDEPISGITVFLHINHNYKTIKKIVTGNDGRFELSAGRIGPVWAGVDYDDYKQYYDLGFYFQGKYYSELKLDKGKVVHVDWEMVPYGKLQINIKNTSCFNQNDSLIIFRTQSIPNFYDNVPNPAIYVGCIDKVGNMNKAPMGWYKYKGKVVRNGIEIQVKDSIYLNAGESKVWDIYY